MMTPEESEQLDFILDYIPELWIYASEDSGAALNRLRSTSCDPNNPFLPDIHAATDGPDLLRRVWARAKTHN